ncbi:MAG TPA: low temperature requirement protein A [Pseudonocardiaceae bacterium]|nr:low temperature requirement protein A [Pseudonocardiaceae bacterium]
MNERLAARPRPRNRRWTRPMPLRDHTVAHRPSTPLELLFDLCFVVSAAVLADQLSASVVNGHPLTGAIRYTLLFMPVWWTWMLFTWFGTAFDNDDVPYRLLTLAQMAGALGIAASMPSAFQGNYTPLTWAFTVARVPLIIAWLRGARHYPAERTFSMRYAVGVAGCTVLWVVLLLAPTPARYAGYVIVMVLELSVPRWAVAAANRQCFHVGHITERYGLFTLLVLGESILAATLALQESFSVGITPGLLVIGASALVSAFSVWWLYFDFVDGRALMLNNRAAFQWGYGHLLVFASIGAMGAGAQVAVLAYEHHHFDLAAQLAMGLPTAACIAAMAQIRRLSVGSAWYMTVGRACSALLVVVAATVAGQAGPAATAAAAAGILVTQAAAETLWYGLRTHTTDPIPANSTS